MITVQIDTREKEEHVKKLTRELDKNMISWTRSKLSVGDVAIYKDDALACIIEHKSYPDFIASIRNGHLESQLIDMDAASCLQFLFIDGTHQNWVRSPNFKYQTMTVEQINGYRIKSQRVHKARLIQFDTELQLCKGICLLCKQLKKVEVVDVKMPERCITTGNPTLDVLLTIEGIGLKTAQKIIDSGLTFAYMYAVAHQLDPDVAKDLLKAEFNISIPTRSFEYLKKVL